MFNNLVTVTHHYSAEYVTLEKMSRYSMLFTFSLFILPIKCWLLYRREHIWTVKHFFSDVRLQYYATISQAAR